MSPDRPLPLVGALAVAALLCNCGSSSPAANANTITIANYLYSPSNLSVKAGATVTVVNDDGTQHSVTSQTAFGNFVLGAVSGVQFDTTPFTNTTTFSISASAPAGTVVPYFCTVHKGTMGMGQGQITIAAP